ncbi:MAG: DMT family transporter [Microbacteriaceae bacterium]
MLHELTDGLVLTPSQFIGIPLALVGAVFLALGTQYQNRGVRKVEANTQSAQGRGLSVKQLALLLARPSWVAGTAMLGLAILLQLASLYFSPIIVVQPLGAIALVITAIVNSRVNKVKMNRGTVIAITMSVAGVFMFVGVAAFTTTNMPIDDLQLIIILIALAVLLLVLAVLFFALRHRMHLLFYVIAAGVLYGFVATLAKVVLGRLQQGDFEWLTLLCLIGLIAAVLLGAYFVQNANSAGPPDMVVAGLTVIDPLVAVLIGIVVLGEAAYAPLWADIVFVLTGALAVWGVFLLARHHPELNDSHE